MGTHGDVGVGSVHQDFNWVYADESARTGASGFSANDVGRIAKQLDNGTFWELIDTTPTWAQRGNVELDILVNAQVGNVINVAIQVEWGGANIAQPYALKGWVSDTAGGDLAATAPDGGIAIGTDGIILNEEVADKLFLLLFDSDGQADIDVDQSSADTFYLNFIMPDGSIVSSEALTFT